MKFGFLGLGAMGTPMALRLIAAGHEVEEHEDGPLARDPSSNALTLLVD